MEDHTIQTLLAKYDKTAVLGNKKLIFCGVDNNDVYNVTAPFSYNGQEYILGRVEARNDEQSRIMFFLKQPDGCYLPDPNIQALSMQDPAVCSISGQFIIGGIDTSEGLSNYRQVFYAGEDIHNLKELAKGPRGMKDIRLIALPEGKIGIFTRPQGKIGGRGRIGFMMIDSLNRISTLADDDYFNAPLIPGNFRPEEWLGVNSVISLEDGRLGILGHIANISEDNMKNYYPITFVFDPITSVVTDMKIIVTRRELPEGPSKRDDLKNVLFSGGLVRNKNGTVDLYTGAGDVEAYMVTVCDPFSGCPQDNSKGTQSKQ